MTDADLELSIVMPCLNEAETLALCIRKAKHFLAEHGIRGEVVVGDNGSTDGSIQLAESEGARVVHVAQRGYGAALYFATLAARGRYVVMGDSDDSYDFSALLPFVERLREGFDVVMGNRFQGGIRPGAMPWKNRYLGNPILSGIGRVFFRCPAGDFHCGLRGYSAEAFRRMDLRTTGMEFASEMVIKATLLRMRIAEVPTTLSRDGRSRPPHLRPWRDGWRHLRFMLLYSPNWLFLYPGLLLALVGAAAVAWLAPAPRHVAGVEFDVHTLLYGALAVILGAQAITFALFARVFAEHEGLLPESGWSRRLKRAATLEVGLMVGGLFMVVGVAGSVAALHAWARADFGPLEPTKTLRDVIPSVLALVLGLQAGLASFFMSVLGLKVRALGAPRRGDECV